MTLTFLTLKVSLYCRALTAALAASRKGSSSDGIGNTRLIPQNVATLLDLRTQLSSSSGFASVSVHLDYLRITGTLTGSRFEELLQFLGADIYIDDFIPWSAGQGCPFFASKLLGIGVIGGFSRLESGNISYMIDMTGEYFERNQEINIWRLFRGLKYTFYVRPTRIDVAIDDNTGHLIPLESMIAASMQGHNFGFRSFNYAGSGDLETMEFDQTVYFGSRNSGKMVRIYKHKFPDNTSVLRLETEFKRGYVVPIFDLIATMERGSALPESQYAYLKNLDASFEHFDSTNRFDCTNEEWDLKIQQLLCAFALSAVDFRDKSSRQDKSKASRKDTKRLPFWQDFLDKLVDAIVIKPIRQPRSLRRSVNWLSKSVSATLAYIRKGLGEDFRPWLLDLLSLGNDKVCKNKFFQSRADYISHSPDSVRIGIGYS